ncbi:hypothetical protein D3C87_324970 [compost metagenome]
MTRKSERTANELLAATTPAQRVARVHYQVTRTIGPVELTVKALAFVAVFAAVVYLLAQSI